MVPVQDSGSVICLLALGIIIGLPACTDPNSQALEATICWIGVWKVWTGRAVASKVTSKKQRRRAGNRNLLKIVGMALYPFALMWISERYDIRMDLSCSSCGCSDEPMVIVSVSSWGLFRRSFMKSRYEIGIVESNEVNPDKVVQHRIFQVMAWPGDVVRTLPRWLATTLSGMLMSGVLALNTVHPRILMSGAKRPTITLPKPMCLAISLLAQIHPLLHNHAKSSPPLCSCAATNDGLSPLQLFVSYFCLCSLFLLYCDIRPFLVLVAVLQRWARGLIPRAYSYSAETSSLWLISHTPALTTGMIQMTLGW